MEKVDQETYEEIKAGQIDEAEPAALAKLLEVDLAQVEEVYRSGTWKQYKDGFTPKTTGPVVPRSAASESIRSLIGANYEQNERIAEHKDVLGMQLRGLMCAVRLLEKRKYDLEQAILRYDGYLLKALKMLDIDALEEGTVDFSRPNQ